MQQNGTKGFAGKEMGTENFPRKMSGGSGRRIQRGLLFEGRDNARRWILSFLLLHELCTFPRVFPASSTTERSGVYNPTGSKRYISASAKLPAWEQFIAPRYIVWNRLTLGA